MDTSNIPIEKLIAYQLALSNALRVIDGYEKRTDTDLSQTKETLTHLSGKIGEAINDEQFEIDRNV